MVRNVFTRFFFFSLSLAYGAEEQVAMVVVVVVVRVKEETTWLDRWSGEKLVSFGLPGADVDLESKIRLGSVDKLRNVSQVSSAMCATVRFRSGGESQS